MRHWVFPSYVGILLACSIIILGINARFETLAKQRGHGSQAIFKLGIGVCSVTFLAACIEVLGLLLVLSGKISTYQWSKLRTFCLFIELGLAVVVCMTTALNVKQTGMDLIGGCRPDYVEGYEVDARVCREWAICLAFMALLLVTLFVANPWCHGGKFPEEFESWVRNQLQRTGTQRSTWLRRPHVRRQPPLPPGPPPVYQPPQAEIDLLPPEPEMIYDTPAAGPNTLLESFPSSKDPEQALGSLMARADGKTLALPSASDTDTPTLASPPPQPRPSWAVQSRRTPRHSQSEDYFDRGGIGGCG